MKTNVAVIFGSRSCEREVAIISAIQLMRHVNRDQYQVIPVYIHEDGHWYTGDALTNVNTFTPFDPQKHGLTSVWLDMAAGSGALMAVKNDRKLFRNSQQLQMVARMDVAIIVMHGLNGEDGSLQGMLELANIPYTSTGIAGSAIGMDKIMMKQFFRGASLPVLPDTWVSRSMWEKHQDNCVQSIEALGYPVFVKPANLGSSIGVSRANNLAELKDAMELALTYDRRALVEKGLDLPIELNCSVMGYDDQVEASPIEMPLKQNHHTAVLSFGEKYQTKQSCSAGMASLTRQLPAQIPDELRDSIQAMSKSIFQMLDCKGVVRIDYMLDRSTKDWYITEINTIPGSLAFYLWTEAGIQYPELIDRMIQYGLQAHEEKNSHQFAYQSDILKSFSFNGKGGKWLKG